jgi:HK97 family phage prohead protease
MENKTFQEQLSVQVKALGENEVQFIVATDDVDRHGERLDISKVDTKNYMNNPVFLWSHDSYELPLGYTTKIQKKKLDNGSKALVATVTFFANIYEKARIVRDMYKEGGMKAVSIGFRARDGKEIDGVWTWTDTEMLEFSAVNIPANQNALVYSKSLEEVETKTSDRFEIVNNDGEFEIKEITKETEEEEKESFKKLLSNIDDTKEIALKTLAAIEAISKDTAKEVDDMTKVQRRRVIVKLKKVAQLGDKSVEMIISDLNAELAKKIN